MYKRFMICLCICLFVCSASVLAQKNIATDKQLDAAQTVQRVTPGSIAAGASLLPDFNITSASVTGQPTRVSDLLFIPLQITVRNLGGNTNEEFNVGAQGRAIDGNAYGFLYFVPGENQMPDPRYGVSVNGLAAGASKTFNGFLILRAQPINQALNVGTTYQITAMVDYNLDPDSFGYAWGVKESNENNNQRIINYP